jgi:hypothetical protein
VVCINESATSEVPATTAKRAKYIKLPTFFMIFILTNKIKEKLLRKLVKWNHPQNQQREQRSQQPKIPKSKKKKEFKNRRAAAARRTTAAAER